MSTNTRSIRLFVTYKHDDVFAFDFSYLLGDAQLSLCGNKHKQSIIPDDVFNAHLISYETYVNNPAIVNDPNLVVRIGGK
jgi:hypothetical protein